MKYTKEQLERINKSKKMIDICKKILAGEIEEYGLMKKVFLPKRIKLYERHLESLYKEINVEETA